MDPQKDHAERAEARTLYSQKDCAARPGGSNPGPTEKIIPTIVQTIAHTIAHTIVIIDMRMKAHKSAQTSSTWNVPAK